MSSKKVISQCKKHINKFSQFITEFENSQKIMTTEFDGIVFVKTTDYGKKIPLNVTTNDGSLNINVSNKRSDNKFWDRNFKIKVACFVIPYNDPFDSDYTNAGYLTKKGIVSNENELTLYISTGDNISDIAVLEFFEV